eukprot:161953-Pleurochrysis_carterae.AAC.1
METGAALGAVDRGTARTVDRGAALGAVGSRGEAMRRQTAIEAVGERSAASTALGAVGGSRGKGPLSEPWRKGPLSELWRGPRQNRPVAISKRRVEKDRSRSHGREEQPRGKQVATSRRRAERHRSESP